MNIFSSKKILEATDDYYTIDKDQPGYPVIKVNVNDLFSNDKAIGVTATVNIPKQLPPNFKFTTTTGELEFTGQSGEITYTLTEPSGLTSTATARFAVSDRDIPFDPSFTKPLDGIVYIESIKRLYDGNILFGYTVKDNVNNGTGFYVGSKTVLTAAHVVGNTKEDGLITRNNDLVEENAHLSNVAGRDRIALSEKSGNLHFVSIGGYDHFSKPGVPVDAALVSLTSPTAKTVFGLEVYIGFKPSEHPLLKYGTPLTFAGFPAGRIEDNVVKSRTEASFIQPTMLTATGILSGIDKRDVLFGN